MDSGTVGNPSPEESWVCGGDTAVRRYWSSTSDSSYFYYLEIFTGHFTKDLGNIASEYQTVCVRGTTQGIKLVDSSKNFVDVGDGTVIDKDTGLVWQQNDSVNSMVWSASVAYCNQLSLAGFTDWRLPTVNEGIMFIDYDTNIFPNSSNHYWTGTTVASNADIAYYLAVSGGPQPNGFKDDNYKFRARCVRDPHK